MRSDERHKEQISKRRAEWISAVNRSDLSRYAALVSENVVWFPPGQPPIEGRRGFEDWLKPFFENFDYEFKLKDVSLRLDNDWAIETGVFETILTAKDARTSRHEGEYVAFWHREPDGEWYLERYVDQSELGR